MDLINSLSEFICKDRRVTSEFEFLKRVRVSSEEFNLAKIIECILDKEGTDETLEKLQIELRKQVEQKRFLLVLEDVSAGNPYQWHKLRALLTNDQVGNKVLITTQDKQVAPVADTTIELQSLYAPMEIHLEPLYVNYIHERLNSKSFSLVDILKSSFDTLPPAIEICFLYSACFTAHPLDKGKLTQQWIAQGFIEPSEANQISLDHLANQYFDVLVSRSFFYNPLQDDLKVEIRFEVHDVARHLAILVSKGEFCSITSSEQIEDISPSVRHVAISNKSNKIPSSLRRFKKLRTFKYEYFCSLSTTTFNTSVLSATLRVLDLSSSSFKQLPSSIGKSNHLRYLDLSNNIYLKNLPSSLFVLPNLEMLSIEGCIFQELPRDLKKLVKLRSLYASTEQVSIPEEVICGLTSLYIFHLNPIHNLETLPKGLENLTALETLVLKFCSSLM